MAFSYRQLFFGGTTFCCCLPVRVGVIIMTVLGMLFAGLLSILLWFEVSSTPDLTHNEKTIFVIGGLVETLLFVVSILGFVGAVVRKQVFVQIYAYFIYFHFLLNLGVAIALLYMLVHVSTTDQLKACQLAIHNKDAQDQCTGILKFGIRVYSAVAAVVLLAELYGAIIVARYVNQVQREKRTARESRIQRQSVFKAGSARYSTIKDQDNDSIPLRSAPLTPHGQEEFDPYEEVSGPDYGAPHTSYDGMPPSDLEHEVHEPHDSKPHPNVSDEGQLKRQGP